MHKEISHYTSLSETGKLVLDFHIHLLIFIWADKTGSEEDL